MNSGVLTASVAVVALAVTVGAGWWYWERVKWGRRLSVLDAYAKRALAQQRRRQASRPRAPFRTAPTYQPVGKTRPRRRLREAS